jgi:dienelactone hydrolase
MHRNGWGVKNIKRTLRCGLHLGYLWPPYWRRHFLGYATLLLDSFSPRQMSSVCAPSQQPKVIPADRAGDVMNAAVLLSKNPNIDGKRIGFSHGGGTAVAVTQLEFESYRPGLIKAAVTYYGGCRNPDLHGHTPLLSLNGDADNWGNPAKTCAAFDAKMRTDQPMELRSYSGVVHSFDNPDIATQYNNLGHPMQYAPDSFVLAHGFRDRYVRDGA